MCARKWCHIDGRRVHIVVIIVVVTFAYKDSHNRASNLNWWLFGWSWPICVFLFLVGHLKFLRNSFRDDKFEMVIINPQKNKKQKQQHYKQTLVACWSQFRASNLLVWVVNKCVSVAVPVKWRSRVIGFGLNIVRPKVWHKRPGVHSIVKLNTTCNKKNLYKASPKWVKIVSIYFHD